MKRWQKKLILLIVGGLFAFFIIGLSRNQILDVYSTPSLDYNAQRIYQLDTLISICGNDYGNGSELQENIDVHGQLFYIILAEIGAKHGLDGLSMFINTWILCIFLLILFYPLIIYLLTDNIWLGLVAPLLLYCCNMANFFRLFTDTYYAQAWSILFSFPLLVLTASKKKWEFATVIACLASVGMMVAANIIRASSGITILIILLMIFMYYYATNKAWKQKLISAGMSILTLFGYFKLEDVVMKIIWHFHPEIPTVSIPSPWHAIWCGLGYYENRYGFAWSDGAAYARAAEICPGVVNYSELYYEILKNDCLEVLKTDPGFIIQTYLKKFCHCIKYIVCEHSGIGIPLLLAGTLLLVAMIIHKKMKGCLGLKCAYCNNAAIVWSLIGITGIAGGVIQGVIGYPDSYRYLLGGYAAGGSLIFGILLYTILVVCDLFLKRDDRKANETTYLYSDK